jgi:hypothetical protein
MEQFVLEGLQADIQADNQAGSVPALTEAGSAAGSLDQSPCDVQEAGDVPSDAVNGHGASPSGPGGGSGRPESANQCDDASRATKRRWSKADDELLRRLWHSDHSLGEIAEMLERTTASLYSRARAFGLSKRGTTAAQSSTAVPASHEEQEPVSAKAAEAVAGHPKTPCAKPRDAGSAASKAGQAEVKLERYCPSLAADGRNWPDRPRTGVQDSPRPAHPGSSSVYSAQSGQGEAGVDPIIHFLRSRDYSVVRVEGGRFKLDGRRVLSAGELREKANQVRQTLGQPPFAPQPGSAG